MAGKKTFLEGVIIRGLGEGTYYMSMKHYQKEIKKKLGFRAYPGTLNIKVAKKTFDLLKNAKPIQIEGFKKEGKTLGGATCYFAKIKSVNGSVILPDLTKHKNVMEFIAPVHVKSALNLKDKDNVKVELIT